MQNNYHATVGHQRQNKVDKATTETNQYMAQNKIIEYLTITLGSKFLEIEQIINDDMYTETTIELLEDHGAWLESQKVFVGKKAGIVANLVSNLQPNSLVFESFLTLESKFNTLEKQIITYLNKIKKKTTKYYKDQEISHKERIGLPHFEGGFVEFKRYKTSFLNFCKGLGEEDKKQHLINSLKPAPKEVVEPLINADQPFDRIWEALDEHYADPKEVSDHIVSNFLNTNIPPNSMEELSKHFIRMRNLASNIISLNLSQEELLVQIYLLKIPGSFRADLENHLPKDKTSYLFRDIAPFVNKNIRAKKYRHNPEATVTNYISNTSVTATPGIVQRSNTGHNNNTDQNNTNTQKKTNSNSKNGAIPKKQQYSCFICGSTNHKPGKCKQYQWGPQMRKALQQKGTCDQCLLKAVNHGSSCRTLNNTCEVCGSSQHVNITCDGNQHPGSWVLKLFKSNNPTQNPKNNTNSQQPLLQNNNPNTQTFKNQ